MLGAQRLLPDGQRPLVARLRLGIAALGMVELRQVVEARGDIGMLGAEHLLPDGQRLFQGWLGVGILPSGIQAIPSAFKYSACVRASSCGTIAAACR